MPREHDDRQAGVLPAHLLEDGVPGHAGHEQIHHHHVGQGLRGRHLVQGGQGRLAVQGHPYFDTAQIQTLGQGLHEFLLVIGQQYTQCHLKPPQDVPAV